MGGDHPVSRDDGLAEAPPGPGFATAAPPAVLRFAAPQRPFAREEPRASANPVRVLLIDGCDEDADLVRDLLARAEGGVFQVDRATDAERGFLRLQRGEHDVVLVEQRLDGADGLDLVRAALRRGVTAPLIVLSGSGDSGVDVAAIDAGAADFLDKEELAVERLERAIRFALARQRRRARDDATSLLDPLTGLCGPHACLDRLELALGRARRSRGWLAVVLLDLEGCAPVHHGSGPAGGDSLLRLVGGRLRRQLRATDTVARLGSDRFAVILEDLARPEHAGAVAAKLQAAIAAPLALGAATVTVTARAGMALFPDDGGDATSLLRQAEQRLAGAPGDVEPPSGDAEPSAPAATAALRAALGRAIAADALALVFQPQVTLSTSELGLATLVRWPDGPRGAMEFPAVRELAEAGALTEPLTDWLLDAACAQAARWAAQGLGPLHVAVPLLSRRQLGWSDLAQRLARHLEAAGLVPARLELEVEEALLLPVAADALKTLAGVRELGVRLAVTDYGGGTTSLALLRDLPLTTVKLARRVLREVPTDETQSLFARTIIRLAIELDLRVVAEGVDTHGQMQFLRDLGCDAAQSLLHGPPLPAAGCTDWIRQAARRS